MYWIALTAAINRALGSAYTIDQVRALPSDELLKLQLWIQYAGQSSNH
jgi:hypothetical protein